MKKMKWLVGALLIALICTTAMPAFAEDEQWNPPGGEITTEDPTPEDPTPGDPTPEDPTPEEPEKVTPHWERPYYILENGEKATGLQTISKKKYYFNSKGVLVKNRVAFKIRANGKTGYYNISKTGVATKLTGTKELAAKRLVALKAAPKKVTAKTRMAALKKAFLWSAGLKYVGNTRNLKGSKALKYYGDYGFKKRRGDCNTKATTFYWMAKVLGYKATVVRGYIPRSLVNGKYGNFQTHTWTQIKIGSKKYGFDPEFNSSTDAKALRKKNKYVGFKFRYGQKGTYAYHNTKKKLIKR